MSQQRNQNLLNWLRSEKLKDSRELENEKKKTIREIWEEHLHLDFNFCKKELQDFRVIDINEAEVVYICYTPFVGGMLKFGEFKEEATLESKGIFLDEFYKSAIARRSRSTFK